VTERGKPCLYPRWPLAAVLLLLALLLLTMTGCAGWDEFSFKKMNFEVFRDPADPLGVVQNSKDGSLRRRALLCLKEPLANGGTQQDQDAVVTALCRCAANDPLAPCRMAAIDTMRKFHDARMVEGLKEAYYRAGSLPPESATVVRMLALGALGDTGDPVAVDTLVRVVREPPTEGPDVDRLQKISERIAAARALGKFKDYKATAALAEVLGKEDDVALRVRAHESLVSITGKDLPPDGQVWQEFLNNPANRDAIAREPTLHERILQVLGWSDD
jgi:HEAT repeat protein